MFSNLGIQAQLKYLFMINVRITCGPLSRERKKTSCFFAWEAEGGHAHSLLPLNIPIR